MFFSSSSLPKFQSTLGYGEQSMQPPGLATGVTAYVFVVRGDAHRITESANEHLAAPTNGEVSFCALSSYVMITVLHVERLTSTSQVVGWIPDRECGVSAIVVDKPKGLFKFPKLSVWMPFVFIDNSIGMATGREIWGYPKEIGQIALPEDGDSDDYRISARLFKTFSRETQGVVEPLIQVRPVTPTKRQTLFHDFKDMGEFFIDKLVHDIAHVGLHAGHTVEHFAAEAKLRFRPQVPVINLKQYRDVSNGKLACYQSLVRGPLTIEKFRGGGLLDGDFKVSVTQAESHQIVEKLGLPSHQDIPVEFAMWIDMDFSVAGGEEIWRAKT